jgi:hypothetical protein
MLWVNIETVQTAQKMGISILAYFIQEDYLNKMKFKNTLLLIILLSSIFITIGCSKTVPKTPLEFQKELLAGAGTYLNTERTWQLDSFYVNGENKPLSSLEKGYKKTFSYDGFYSDSENNTGIWEISTLAKLKVTKIYTTKTEKDSSVFDIVSINAARLKLNIKFKDGTLGSYSFKISN